MSQKNMGRLAQDMKREVIAIIGRLKDPRLEGGLLTVTRLDVTPDLDVAKVFGGHAFCLFHHIFNDDFAHGIQ